MRTTETRLRRLEHAMTLRRVVVVTGHSEAEHDAKVAALKARGEARDGDLIVCVRKFSDPASARGIAT